MTAVPRDDAMRSQARALGDPTRHRIYRYIAGARRPVGVAELAEHLGVNHNTVRQHPAKLCNAGLVVTVRTGPARCHVRDQYVEGWPLVDNR